MYDLGTLGGAASAAQAINTRGQVVGWAETADGEVHAFLWSPRTEHGTAGEMQDLGTLGGWRSLAFGLNDQGDVVGTAETVTGISHAFRWTPGVPDGAAGQMTDLGAAYAGGSAARGINTAGEIVGEGEDLAEGTLSALRWTPPPASCPWGRTAKTPCTTPSPSPTRAGRSGTRTPTPSS